MIFIQTPFLWGVGLCFFALLRPGCRMEDQRTFLVQCRHQQWNVLGCSVFKRLVHFSGCLGFRAHGS